jgi:hypothetical protein
MVSSVCGHYVAVLNISCLLEQQPATPGRCVEALLCHYELHNIELIF